MIKIVWWTFGIRINAWNQQELILWMTFRFVCWTYRRRRIETILDWHQLLRKLDLVELMLLVMLFHFRQEYRQNHHTLSQLIFDEICMQLHPINHENAVDLLLSIDLFCLSLFQHMDKIFHRQDLYYHERIWMHYPSIHHCIHCYPNWLNNPRVVVHSNWLICHSIVHDDLRVHQSRKYRIISKSSSKKMRHTVLNAQHEPHCAWSFTGVTRPWSRQSIETGRVI